ncbi:MAG: hypothetical protein L7F78_26580, partial [Syntrophales bacterium LBB04]|nr:hypothetical protein [Syntrophales bacterium LBB04]
MNIDNPERLRKILAVFSRLDDIRWSYASNYNLINHCDPNLTEDERLLSHWLCYVTDRQMPFERIWEVGGYVLSHLVRSFTRDKSSVLSLLKSYIHDNGDAEKLRLECPLEGQNERLALYGIRKSPVPFASRYMPSDILSICRTLLLLDGISGRSLARFVSIIINNSDNHQSAIKNMAISLHFLTYADNGTASGVDVNARIQDMPAKLKPLIDDFNANPMVFISNLSSTFLTFGKKRLWCSIRDYLKSPEFNAYFVKSIEPYCLEKAQQWDRNHPALKAALNIIELPGDVWNNNRTFCDGLFTPYVKDVPNVRNVLLKFLIKTIGL